MKFDFKSAFKKFSGKENYSINIPKHDYSEPPKSSTEIRNVSTGVWGPLNVPTAVSGLYIPNFPKSKN
jgi:hypothetical protein